MHAVFLSFNYVKELNCVCDSLVAQKRLECCTFTKKSILSRKFSSHIHILLYTCIIIILFFVSDYNIYYVYIYIYI